MSKATYDSFNGDVSSENLDESGTFTSPQFSPQNSFDQSVCSTTPILKNNTANLQSIREEGRQQTNGVCISEHDADAVEHEGEIERELWAKKVDFLLSVIGFAVDLGNVWRFPYICYKNGGGAFLLPYSICFLFGGLPLFFMELALGQYYRTGCITLWNKLCPAMKGVGFAIIFINMYMSFFYNTVIATAFYYLYSSFTLTLPWVSCGNPWNDDKCLAIGQTPRPDQNLTETPASQYYTRYVLENYKAAGLQDMGGLKWELSICLMFVFIVVYFSLWKGIKGSGKVVWITATAPYIILFCLLLRGLTLPGAMMGVKYYLTPVPEKILEITVWKEAAQQIFFSLGPGFGVLLALASYNPFHNNCYRDAIVTSVINCLTSFLAGFVIFSVLGYLAVKQGKDIENVAKEGSGLVFEVYPEAIANMPWSTLWALVFFFMLITLGLDSTFGGLESIITALSDQFPNKLGKHREKFVLVLITCCFIGALPTTTRGGMFMERIYAEYGTANPMIIVVLLETLTVCYCYGFRRLRDDITEMIGMTPGYYWVFCWAFLGPAFLVIITCFSIRDLGLLSQHPESMEVYPWWSDVIAYCIFFSSLMWIPGYFIFCFFTTPAPSLSQKLCKMFQSVPVKRTVLPKVQIQSADSALATDPNGTNAGAVDSRHSSEHFVLGSKSVDSDQQVVTSV
ncbi:sodium-dependent serotonin transporter-like isoform X1 [Convolutriloba macropyga]|uniref:sodium-dependent serotonin transporter-like isoform X1 n=1 Tax=Convolutriloba macropyga TaxID=536237 RepID=UPI003F51D807